ncbi:DNA mismatch repair protein [Heterostelium album PN500]|uniref:DNA mismatch repair protein n=1 Tax=Heterostelium pallidum (strain ATCC 26659 / Pp 5 / PN500) TaxID=670386 RepID=D3B4I1_HETP5|nr:DNA mismatch repair protein [Heterostelium album PN500]EFA84229.1 DNA mismatch repair protein [Heterostelium album PN500]|eukprot:XP_020436345.1 DNA mismatch repair protein [Heterostelium album PN500]
MSRRLKLPNSFSSDDSKQTNINSFFVKKSTTSQTKDDSTTKTITNNDDADDDFKDDSKTKSTATTATSTTTTSSNRSIKNSMDLDTKKAPQKKKNETTTVLPQNNSNNNNNNNKIQSPDQRVSSTGRKIVQKAVIDFNALDESSSDDDDDSDIVIDGEEDEEDSKSKKKSTTTTTTTTIKTPTIKKLTPKKSTTKTTSPQNKTLGNKRKKIESDDDYEPEVEEEESDDDYIPDDNEGSDDDFESMEDEDDDYKSTKNKSKSNNNKKSSSSNSKSSSKSKSSSSKGKSKEEKEENGDDEMPDIDVGDLNNSKVELSQSDRVLADGRVVLPAGTPVYQRDLAAGRKLVKAMVTYEAQKLAALKLSGKGDGEEGEGAAPSDEEDEDDKKGKGAKGGKAGNNTKAGKAGSNNNKIKYTPLEQQVIEIKKQYPDTVLMVECGYKFKFFGNDAEIATRVLNIYSYVAKNFLNASVPVQRLYFHLRRLVYAGYKVGVVEQIETAALKAVSSSKSQPFERKLTRLYTASTFIDDIDINENDPVNISPNYLVSFTEQYKTEDLTEISFVAVSISTGEIICDTFKDDVLRTHLETRLTHLKPTEVLLPPERTIEKQQQDTTTTTVVSPPYLYLSNLTKKCIKTYCKLNNVRVQTMTEELYDYDRALSSLVEFYEADKSTANTLSSVMMLPKAQVICLNIQLSYLKEFIQFTSLLKVSTNFKTFTLQNHLILPHSTIENLEILKNEWDKSEKGSLFWVLNQTQTIAGRRLIVEWLCKPLMKLELIKERQDAVNELITSTKTTSHNLISTFLKGSIPDLQRNLSKIYYQSQCLPKDFLSTMKSFQKLDQLFKEVSGLKELKSKLLNDIFTNEQSNTKFNERLQFYLSSIDHTAASKDEKENLWSHSNIYPLIVETQEKIKTVQEELSDHLRKIRKDLGKPTLEYLHQPKNNLEYLIELPINFKSVPKDWLKVNATQKLARYHVPAVVTTLKLLQQNRELLTIRAKESWLDFLSKFSEDYSLFSNVISKLANLDCLYSLSVVGKQAGYVRPEFTENSGIEIVNGRHPIVEHLLQGEQYVPNSVRLSPDAERAMIITGPNMGGKSSFIRQTSLIVIMAQIGSNVPAASCRLGVVDAIYTRMGAHDNIEKGSSTFFVELQETSAILQQATPRSLVILDELGRGTSTHDGVAIAYSSLRYIIEKKQCFCLFVTHYPLLAELENQYPTTVANYHMGFIEQKQEDYTPAIPKVIFLYQVTKGAAKNSYGLNVARIADLPKSVLMISSAKSDELKHSITNKVFNNNNNNDDNNNNNDGEDDNNNNNNDKTTDHDRSTMTQLKKLLKDLSIPTNDKHSIYKEIINLKSSIEIKK